MRMRFATLAFVLAVVADQSPAFGQEANLRYRWVKGDEVRYRTTQQSGTTMSGLPGIGEMTIDQTLVQVVRMVVDEIAADGGVTLRQTIESVRMEQSTPFGKTVFDSTSTEKPADQSAAILASSMSALIGESITLVLAPNGKVIKVEGMSRIFDKAMKSLPPGPATDLIATQFKSSLSDEAMRGTVEQGFVIFPDHPVKSGETWTNQFDMTNPLLGAMTASRTSTLKGVETINGASMARIAMTFAMKQGAPAAPGPLGVNVKVTDSVSSGEVLFDMTKGRIAKTTFTTEMPMSLSMAQPGAGQVDVKGVARSTMTMEIIEK